MSENNSAARKRYWASLLPEQRSKRMAHIARIKQSKLTPLERKKNAMKMVKARTPKK